MKWSPFLSYTSVRNLHKAKKLCKHSNKIQPIQEEFIKKIKPKPIDAELALWLNFPKKKFNTLFHTLILPINWLSWVDRCSVSLDPLSTDIRQRIISKASILGTTAGLFLVINAEAFLKPPETETKLEEYLIEAYGCIMFFSFMCFTCFVIFTLTTFYGLVESMRDDVAYEAFNNLKTRYGGLELYYFNTGMQITLIALVFAGKVIYSDYVVFILIGCCFLVYCFGLFMAREIFICLDPVSAIHMGLTNDPVEITRATLLSNFIRKKVKIEINTAEAIFHPFFEIKKKKSISKEKLDNKIENKMKKNDKIQNDQNNEIETNNQEYEKKENDSVDDNIVNISNLNHEFNQFNGCSDLPSLEEIFVKKNFEIGLNEDDLLSAYNFIQKSGFNEISELLLYLNNCSSRNKTIGENADSTRNFKMGLLIPLLTSMGIPHFHAFKIILFLKPFILTNNN